jgi:hypothetical protein
MYRSEEANNLSTNVLGFFCGSVDCFEVFVDNDGGWTIEVVVFRLPSDGI